MRTITIILCLVLTMSNISASSNNIILNNETIYLNRNAKNNVLSITYEYIRSIYMYNNEKLKKIIKNFYNDDKDLIIDLYSNNLELSSNRYYYEFNNCGKLLSEIVPIINENCLKIKKDKNKIYIEKHIMSYTEIPEVYIEYSTVDNNRNWIAVKNKKMVPAEYSDKIYSYKFEIPVSKNNIEFALKIVFKNSENSYWDNNKGNNYIINNI